MAIGIFFFVRKSPESNIVHEPYALLFSGEFEYFTPGDTDCFSITKQGKAFASTTVTLGLKFFGEISTSTPFENVANMIDTLAVEVEIQAVSLLKGGEYIIHSKIGKILVKGNDLALVSSNVLAFLRDKKGKTFEYIDARHGNSIFFK